MASAFEIHSPDGRRFIARADEAAWWIVHVDSNPVGGFLTRDVARAVVRSDKPKLGWVPVLHKFMADGAPGEQFGEWLAKNTAVHWPWRKTT